MSNTTSSINATKHTVNPFEATPIKAHKKLLKFEDSRNCASNYQTTLDPDAFLKPIFVSSSPQKPSKHTLRRIILNKYMHRSFSKRSKDLLILFCCGFLHIETSHRFFSREANLPKMSSGFIVLCNHTHPFDFLYFGHILSPTFVKIFTKVKNSGESELLLAPLDFRYTLKYFFSRKFGLSVKANEVDLSKKKPYKKLNAIKLAEHNFFEKEGPLVIFFEGALTNGKGVLNIDPLLVGDIYNYQKKYYRNTVITSISYDDNANASTTPLILSTISLLMNPINTMRVKFSTIPKIPLLKEDMAKYIYDHYNHTHMIPHVNLNSEDYGRFLETGNVKKIRRNGQPKPKSKME